MLKASSSCAYPATRSAAPAHGHGAAGSAPRRPARAAAKRHFMGELTAQVGISEFSKREDRKTWYENEGVCGQVSYETWNSFSYQVLQLDIPT